MLKKAITIISIFTFFSIFIVFLPISIVKSEYVNCVTFFQFSPSLLKFLENMTIFSIGFILVIVSVFLAGRFYCSSLCPLGILFDIVFYLRKKLNIKTNLSILKHLKIIKILRYSFLTIFVAAFFSQLVFIVGMMDPFSIFGKISSNLFAPLVNFILNNLSIVFFKLGIYSISSNEPRVDFYLIFFTFIVLILLIVIAFFKGRLYCSAVCPVGSFFSLISRFSFFKMFIRPGACVHCGLCKKICRAGCIDSKNSILENSFCVRCLDCYSVCPTKAIGFYSFINRGKDRADYDPDRRNILLASFSFVVLFQNKIFSNPLIDTYKMKQKKISPPGSISVSRFNKKCTSCQLCVEQCPTGVLRQSFSIYGLKGFFQPYLDYRKNFCLYECNICSMVCPTGAIRNISLDEKKETQIGKAIFIKENCVVYTNGTDCGACSETCPTKAVRMVPYAKELKIPEVDSSICIGCGACEFACPVIPEKSIYVDGLMVHKKVKKSKKMNDKKNIEIKEKKGDFPF